MRGSGAEQDGFSLIELLVVILLIRILAAIALPSVLGQDAKAEDADAKSEARALLGAMRICGIDQNGSFTAPRACNLRRLRGIEPTIAATAVSAEPRVSLMTAASPWMVDLATVEHQ